jgi:hypothetical protein
MIALLRTIIGVLALSLLPLCAHARSTASADVVGPFYPPSSEIAAAETIQDNKMPPSNSETGQNAHKTVSDLVVFINDDFDRSDVSLNLTRDALKKLVSQVIAPLSSLDELARSKYFVEKKAFSTPNYGEVIQFRFETRYRRITLWYSVRNQQFIVDGADATALNSL